MSLKEQLKQAAAGASEGDAARAELGLGDNYYSTSGMYRPKAPWQLHNCMQSGLFCFVCLDTQSGSRGVRYHSVCCLYVTLCLLV